MASYPYINTPTALKEFMDGISDRRIPTAITKKHLDSLGLRSSNHRRIPGILEFIGFVDKSRHPTQRYKEFRDPARRGSVMAQALRQSYSELFNIHSDAYQKDEEALRNFFAAHSTVGVQARQGMVTVFRTLCGLADFEAAAAKPTDDTAKSVTQRTKPSTRVSVPQGVQALNINIQLELPVTSEPAVYDALFQAMRKYILKASDEE